MKAKSLLKKKMTKNLTKLYLKSPTKIQLALAKHKIKAIMNKKMHQIEDMIRH